MPFRALILLLGLRAWSGDAQVSCSASPVPLPIVSNPISLVLAGATRLVDVKMLGQATRYDGQKGVNGSVVLEVNASGSTSASYVFAGVSTGEQSTAAGVKRTCTRKADDGSTIPFPQGDCLQPTSWVLPYMTLISQTPIGGLAVADEGLCTGPSGSVRCLHLALSLTSPKSDSKTLALIQTLSGSDLDLDPVTLLPEKLTFQSQAGAPSHVVFKNEVRYSGYQLTSEVQIPYHIQKYLNGVLALDITITSVAIQ